MNNVFTIVIFVILGLIILLGILLLIFNKLLYGMFKHRFDGDIRFKFLTMDNYPDLVNEDVSVKSVYNVNLNGKIFYYPNLKIKGVVIFYHGLLSGYYNYLNVIEYLTKNGYKVVAFDMYGCMSSEGTSTKGMAHGDKDNKNIIDFVTSNKELNKYPLYVLGHSWGGHLAMTSLIHDDKNIKKAVALCPYNSNIDCTYSLDSKAKIFAPLLYLLNLIKFGHEASYKVTDAIKLTNAKVMIFSCGKDHIVKPKYSYLKYKKVIEKNNLDNVTLKFYKDNDHFIYMDDEAARMFTKEISFPRATPIDFDKLDYSILYKLNEKVMKEIVDFFDNK